MLTPRYLDAASLLTVLITLVLFGAACWFKGLSHDLLLEAGVFLVSVKLILITSKITHGNQLLSERLERIERKLGL